MPGGASVDGTTVEELLREGAGTMVDEIPIIALDEEIPRAGLPTPDFVKIDIERWEIEALRGARRGATSAAFLEMPGETIGEKKRKVAEIVASLGHQLPACPTHRKRQSDRTGKCHRGNGRTSVLLDGLTRQLSFPSTTTSQLAQ